MPHSVSPVGPTLILSLHACNSASFIFVFTVLIILKLSTTNAGRVKIQAIKDVLSAMGADKQTKRTIKFEWSPFLLTKNVEAIIAA